MAKLKTGRHTSAIKAWRQSQKRASANRGVKAEIKEFIKELNAFIAKRDFDSARKALPKIYSLLDKASKKGTLHRKTASRKKSRLTARLGSAAKNPS